MSAGFNDLLELCGVWLPVVAVVPVGEINFAMQARPALQFVASVNPAVDGHLEARPALNAYLESP